MLNTITDTVLAVFTNVASKDEKTLRRLAEFDGDIYVDKETLIFSLIGLYRFANINNYSSPEKLTYQEFRKHIYSSDINYRLGKTGLRIDIHQSTSKVDTTYYKLTMI